ncbi:hypothetical protein TNCV_2274551 [Trichonephila clavipes]|nr:hypothetical protein TNCV_2274551 [Trichonephila clavipes]
MTYHNRLDDSLRWKAIDMLEVRQVGVARSLQVARKCSPALWNQFQTDGTVTRKVTTENRHLHRIVIWL